MSEKGLFRTTMSRDRTLAVTLRERLLGASWQAIGGKEMDWLFRELMTPLANDWTSANSTASLSEA